VRAKRLEFFAGSDDARYMKRMTLALLLAGCGQAYPDDMAVEMTSNVPTVAKQRADPSQILTPLPRWRGWCYQGPADMRGAWVDAVSWWRAQNQDIGEEMCGSGQIRVVNLSDRPGPTQDAGDSAWAWVHLRGDMGADVRVYEGSWEALRVGSLERMFRHEIGHVMGLQHSQDPTCVMGPEWYVGDKLCAHERSLLLNRP
jgi:hypothetical protein